MSAYSVNNQLWIYNEQDLSQNTLLFNALNQLSLQTFGSAIECTQDCLYFIFTQQPVSSEDQIINNFAGMFTVVKPPNLFYYEIYNVITNPSFRGLGAATVMISAGVKVIRNNNDPNAMFWLSIDPDNPYYEAAVKSYLRSGFTYPRIFSKSPSGINWKKAMIGMTTENSVSSLQSYSFLVIAKAIRVYALRCNVTKTVNIDVESIKTLYEYNVRNNEIQGTLEMSGHFTIHPPTGIYYLDKYEPFIVSTNLTQDDINIRTQTYDAVWGNETTTFVPTTREVVWHTHPIGVISNAQAGARLVDFPSEADLISGITLPMNTPIRLNILFSHEHIYLFQMSNIFATVLSYLRVSQQYNIQIIYDNLRNFLSYLYNNIVGPRNDFLNKYVPNIREHILSTWLYIKLENFLDAYSNSPDVEVQTMVNTLNGLMSKDELLFNITRFEYEDVIKQQLFTVSYYQI